MEIIKKIQLSKKQVEAYKILSDDETNELLFGGGAGGGKSRVGCFWIINRCLEYKEIKCLIGRNKLTSLKQTTLATFFDVLRNMGLTANVDYFFNQQSNEVVFINKSKVLFKDLFLYPSDPEFDSLGSLELTYFFIDEANQICFKAYEVLKSRLRYKHKEYNLIPKCLLTCNPSKNWVYKEFYKPFVDNKLPKSVKFIQSLAGDNPFLPKTYIESLKKIKNKATKERLLNGNWDYDDDPSTLFNYDDVLNCFTRYVENIDTKEWYITGDIARKGRDRMTIGIWHGLQLIKIIDLPFEIKSNIKLSTEFIINLAKKENIPFTHIILDEDGVGGGVVDNIPNCTGFINNASPIQDRDYEKETDKNLKELKKLNYQNLKTQCYYKLADLVHNNEIGITENNPDIKDLITEELMVVKEKNADNDSKLQIIGKDEIKQLLGRSPDFADMIMMRILPTLKPKKQYRIINL
jgi:phage terminase large subunit